MGKESEVKTETTEATESAEEETAEQEETAAGQEEEETAAEVEKEEKPEQIPKYRYDELLAKSKDLETKLEQAAIWIRDYAARQQREQAKPLTPEDRLARLENAYGTLAKRYDELLSQQDSRAMQEQQAADLAMKVDAAITKNPHLADWVKDIYRVLAFEPDRPVEDVVKELNAKLGKAGAAAVNKAVKPKAAAAGRPATSAVAGTPAPSTTERELLRNVKTTEDLSEYIAGRLRAARGSPA